MIFFFEIGILEEAEKISVDQMVLRESSFGIIKNNMVDSDNMMPKVKLSPSKSICVICFMENPLKTIKNVFYFILKALFVLKICKFLSWPFVHADKTA